MADFIGAVDQGTTSTRFMIFDAMGRYVAHDQKEHEQIYPRPGWVEHNPKQIWENTGRVIRGALGKAGISGSDLAAIGVTNQRETTVVWDKTTGEPVCNAIVWQCTRTDGICRKLAEKEGPDRFRAVTGLPLATYFSGPKLAWILNNVDGVKQAAQTGRLIFGTMETFIIWHLTGGAKGGCHVTDITNASRTLMMNLADLKWEGAILEALGVPEAMLPEIKPSIDPDFWGVTDENGPMGAKVPVCGALGDQQAALVGQTCFSKGEAKNTYGTGCFLLLNTGNTPIASKHGLLTTAGYQIRGQKPVYCLEGSIAIAGALVQWLRDNLGIIQSAPEVEELAKTVDDNGGLYIVPAFSGLFAPYWRSDARGVMVGLTRYVNKGHMARAALEAVAHQALDIAGAMNKDSGVALTSLKVDGGMVKNELLMQFQADLLNVPVIRPKITETTVLGAAYAAGLASGFWPDMDALKEQWEEDETFLPNMPEEDRSKRTALWKKAVDRTLGWV